MKKSLSILLASLMAVSLAACGSSQPAATTAAPAETTAAPAATTAAPAETKAEAPAETQAADSGETYTIVIGESGSEETSNAQGHNAFKEYVEEKSGGRIKVEIYCNAVLGSDREEFESVQIGQVTMAATGLTQVTNFIPELVGVDLPFFYRDSEQVLKIFKDPEFLEYLQTLAAKANYHLCGTAMQGFRTLTSSKEIHTLADCKGLKIRVVESPTPLAIWNALGASPAPLAFAEVYTALQQGTYDAEENPTELIYSQKFYEQQKYIIDTNHQIQPTFCVMNLDFYNNLPDDLRQICDEGFEKWAEATQNYTNGNLEMYDKTFTDFGCELIHLDDAARQEFIDATESVRNDIAGQYPEIFENLQAAVERVG